MADAPLLEARDLKLLGDNGDPSRPIFSGLGFDLRPGEIVALMGPRGSGKTALLRCLVGLMKPSSGEILYRGTPVDRVERGALRRQVAYVPSAPEASRTGLAQKLRSAFRFLSGSNRRLPPSAGAASMLRDLGLAEDGLDARPVRNEPADAALAAVVRALAGGPECLLLDRPDARLGARAEALERLLDAKRREGLAVLFVTGRDSEAQRLADRALILVEPTVSVFARTADVFPAG